MAINRFDSSASKMHITIIEKSIIKNVRERCRSIRARFERKDRPNCVACYKSFGTDKCQGCSEFESLLSTVENLAKDLRQEYNNRFVKQKER